MSPMKIKMMLDVYSLAHPEIDCQYWDTPAGLAARASMLKNGYMTDKNKPTSKLASWVAFIGTMAGELDQVMTETDHD